MLSITPDAPDAAALRHAGPITTPNARLFMRLHTAGVRFRRRPNEADFMRLDWAVRNGHYPMTLHECGAVECERGIMVRRDGSRHGTL